MVALTGADRLAAQGKMLAYLGALKQASGTIQQATGFSTTVLNVVSILMSGNWFFKTLLDGQAINTDSVRGAFVSIDTILRQKENSMQDVLNGTLPFSKWMDGMDEVRKGMGSILTNLGDVGYGALLDSLAVDTRQFMASIHAAVGSPETPADYLRTLKWILALGVAIYLAPLYMPFLSEGAKLGARSGARAVERRLRSRRS
jgi:hypothetical protein